MTKPENHLKPWSVEDLIVLANTAPTKYNCKWLAKSLGRTENAVRTQWYLMYCSKSYLRDENGNLPPQYENIIKARNAVGLVVSISKN